MKKPNLKLSLAEAVRIIEQASADSTPQLAIAVAATVLADFARQSLEPQPPITTGNVVFTEIDHHKRTAVAVSVSQADLQRYQDIITLLTNDTSLLLHTSALRMARHIDSLQTRLTATERERDDVIACARGASLDDAAIHSMRKYIAEKIKIEDERNEFAARITELERVTFTDEQIDAGIRAVEALRIMRKVWTPKEKRDAFLRAARGGG